MFQEREQQRSDGSRPIRDTKIYSLLGAASFSFESGACDAYLPHKAIINTKFNANSRYRRRDSFERLIQCRLKLQCTELDADSDSRTAHPVMDICSIFLGRARTSLIWTFFVMYIERGD
jgi:hypothetical protein